MENSARKENASLFQGYIYYHFQLLIFNLFDLIIQFRR